MLVFFSPFMTYFIIFFIQNLHEGSNIRYIKCNKLALIPVHFYSKYLEKNNNNNNKAELDPPLFYKSALKILVLTMAMQILGIILKFNF